MYKVRPIAAVTLSLAVVLGLALSGPAEADRKRNQNTMTGAIIGSGVGYLVGGSKGATAGAVVGAIAGYNK
ncbi:YMGG-like glycine zipper-containing protein [Ruegeria marina]|uniref:YMGG-like Gly-zipper n=1 Tax=Ruegeria marina TaxID=639004 RepID=A0A1G7F779_9RHOB|nr:YMGG-like glycine zipper-containing protein [Ruegeria marina]SDE71714.1 YMGG-like Gly-zipper [Ruegeria marina]